MEMTHLRLNSKNLDSEAVIGSETALVTRPINRTVFFFFPITAVLSLNGQKL